MSSFHVGGERLRCQGADALHTWRAKRGTTGRAPDFCGPRQHRNLEVYRGRCPAARAEVADLLPRRVRAGVWGRRRTLLGDEPKTAKLVRCSARPFVRRSLCCWASPPYRCFAIGFGPRATRRCSSRLRRSARPRSRSSSAATYGRSRARVARAHRLVTGYQPRNGSATSHPMARALRSAATTTETSMSMSSRRTAGNLDSLTYHPGADVAVGWTPRRERRALPFGARELFRSGSTVHDSSERRQSRANCRLTMAETGSFSPDGTQLAYVPNFRWEPFWKGYRGGQTTPIYIADLKDSHATKIPRVPTPTMTIPMWVGDTVYFLSDRADRSPYTATIRARTASRARLPGGGFDITDASAGPDAIVYSQFGALHVFDTATHRVDARVRDPRRRHATGAAALGKGRETDRKRRHLAER